MKKKLPGTHHLKAILVCLLLLTAASSFAQVKRYVTTTTAGTGDGSSWANASASLQDMIDASAAGDSIFVAQGVYQYTDPVLLKDKVKLYGSFAGTESNLAQRKNNNLSTRSSYDTVSIFYGTNIQDYFTNDIFTSSTSSLTAATIIDGFLIMNTNGTDDGGIRNEGSSPTINNCVFMAHSGSGIINNSNASPIITNCVFSGNWSQASGCGINNVSSSPTITNCTFTNNKSTNTGGGIYNQASAAIIRNCSFTGNRANNGGGIDCSGTPFPTISNCSFTGNSAGYASNFYEDGGGIYNYYCSPIISNCVFSGNTARNGAGFYTYGPSTPIVSNCTFSGNWASTGAGGIHNSTSSSTTIIKNCILYGNSSGIATGGTGFFAVSYSLVQGIDSSGKGNLDSSTDPLFVNALAYTTAPFTGGNYTLQPGSPCINTGDSSSISQYLGSTDLAGNPRYAGIIDMGAYETVATSAIVYTFNGNGNWTTVANWQNNTVPPAILPAGSTIIITGNVILNTQQTISKGAGLIIQTGHTLSLPLNLTIQ